MPSVTTKYHESHKSQNTRNQKSFSKKKTLPMFLYTYKYMHVVYTFKKIHFNGSEKSKKKKKITKTACRYTNCAVTIYNESRWDWTKRVQWNRMEIMWKRVLCIYKYIDILYSFTIPDGLSVDARCVSKVYKCEYVCTMYAYH